MTASVRTALLALLLPAFAHTAARAQDAPEPARVSVTAPDAGGTGAAPSPADSAAARLLAVPARLSADPPTENASWRRAAGRRRHTLEGAIVGGTLGALIGFLTLRPDGTHEPDSCARGCGGASGGGFLIGAGVGALLGGVIGYNIRTGPER